MSNVMSYSMLSTTIGSNSEKLAFIDFKLRFTGFVKRADLNSEYGLSDASASRLISQYTDLRSENLFYDRARKLNVIKIENYTPLIHIDVDTALGMLAHGFNKNKLSQNPVLPYARIGTIPNATTSVDSVSKITRAISNNRAVECTYVSSNSKKENSRVLVPVAIFSDGKNWMFRAFDRSETNDSKSNFKNFNFSRVFEVKELSDDNSYQRPYEGLSQDRNWHLLIPVSLEIHPSLHPDEQKVIRRDFGMQYDQDELAITEKASFLWILTKQWCIETHKSNNKDAFYKFRLKNSEMLEQFI